ncbi:hypothetical protein AX17_002007 [Amanita inopinata Kibby_2008]|nr:hypothetical protein AX17_002007 [Amanita inopinata Kibby_2008]
MSVSSGAKAPAFVLQASTVARAHTFLAATAFLTALIVGCFCHYKKIVQNGVAGYPHEWFPSVSATIGDWYPERNLFQILIALTSGPRFGIVAIQYHLHQSKSSNLPLYVFISGIVRTLTCGGWVYITSSDDHDAHDIFMISYILCNLPWMLGGIACTPSSNRTVRSRRKYIATAFFVIIIPLVYFFIQHKVHRIPGAYTNYAFFEWSLIFLDVLYDSITELEFKSANLRISLGVHSQAPVTPNEIVTTSVSQNIHANIKISSKEVKAKQHTEDLEKTVPFDSTLAVSFMSDVYLSYVFWSIFTALIPTLFYFSVWELGIAGQELALVSTLTPIFLSITPLLNMLRTTRGLAMLHLLSFSGLLAYALDKPLHRLFIVSFATAVSMLLQVIDWSGLSGSDIGYQAILTGLGLIISSLSKHFNHSNNPIWPFIGEEAGGCNKVGLALALLALYQKCCRTSYTLRSGRRNHPSPMARSNTLAAALSLGSLLFTLSNLLADSSTLIACMLIAQLACLALAFDWSGRRHLTLNRCGLSWAHSYTKSFLALTTVLSLLISLYRWPPHPSPSKSGPRIINAGIWTVHFGINNIGRDSQHGIKTLLQDMQLDIVGLLETDLHRPSFGHRDLTRVIVEELGYNVDLGPGPNSHTWGAVLLSKFPIINSTHHLLPSPHGELAPAIEAVLDVYGTEIMVVVSHNGQEETPLDRELQSKELARIMSTAYPTPVIFLGYVVTEPHAERPAPYKYMVEDGRVHDIDKNDMDRWCEYIFYRGLYRTGYARVSRGIITDTEMQIGQFVLPRHGYSVTDDSEQARYMRVPREQLSSDHWFPSEYYQHSPPGGKNGHYYHVFDGPLYYQIPEAAVL